MSCELCDLSQMEVIYQDDYCFSTVILEPLKEGHLMVLPKRHVIDLKDLNAEESKAILNFLGRLEKVLFELYEEDPVVLMNRGKHSTQPHLHFHIVPAKFSLRYLFSKYEKLPFKRQASSEERKLIGDKIRTSLNNN